MPIHDIASQDRALTTNEKAALKRLFDKFITNNKTFYSIKDMEEKIDTACTMIMSNLLLSKSSTLQIPEPDENGSTKKFKSFKRFVASLLVQTDNDTETSSEAILSSIEKIKPVAEELKSEDSHEP